MTTSARNNISAIDLSVPASRGRCARLALMAHSALFAIRWVLRNHRAAHRRAQPMGQFSARASCIRPERPPVLLLGGDANALSVARELGSAGVRVFMLGENDCVAHYSRYCHCIRTSTAANAESDWAELLLSKRAAWLHGAVLMSCSDAGIRVLLRHRSALLRHYLLDQCNPVAQVAMLDKLTTYQHAVAAGVATPRFWAVTTRDDVLAVRNEMMFPLLVKPRLSHVFEQHFGCKHLVAHTQDEVIRAFDATANAGMDALLTELIPGGDDRLSSYFTYLDERGTPMFHFTKRVIRRYPSGMGGATYHITDWIPDLIAPANRLLDEVGMRGIANVEFKHDPRDGKYKLIECNGRFVASNRLVSESGIPLATLVYNRVTNQPLPEIHTYTRGLRMWDPARDFSAFRELKRQHRITLREWLGSIWHRQILQFFSWSDPLPAVMRLFKPIRGWVDRAIGNKRELAMAPE